MSRSDLQPGKSLETTKLSTNSLNTAGWLLFVFATQFTIVLFVAEARYAGYSISNNYISDLGVGSTGPLFDTSIIILGVAVMISSYFLYRGFGSRAFSILTFLTGVGAFLVGVFNENFGSIHGYVSDLTFIVGPITAIYAFRFEKSPMKFFSPALGILSFIAIAVFMSSPGTLGLGVGGWERMIVYPFLLWGIGFGGYLIGVSKSK
jgi:hypothetical membrane protein